MEPLSMVLLALLFCTWCAVFACIVQVRSLQLARNTARFTNTFVKQIRQQEHGALSKHRRPSSSADRGNDEDKKLADVQSRLTQALQKLASAEQLSARLDIDLRSERSRIWELEGMVIDMRVSILQLRSKLQSEASNRSRIIEQLRREVPDDEAFTTEPRSTSPVPATLPQPLRPAPVITCSAPPTIDINIDTNTAATSTDDPDVEEVDITGRGVPKVFGSICRMREEDVSERIRNRGIFDPCPPTNAAAEAEPRAYSIFAPRENGAETSAASSSGEAQMSGDNLFDLKPNLSADPFYDTVMSQPSATLDEPDGASTPMLTEAAQVGAGTEPAVAIDLGSLVSNVRAIMTAACLTDGSTVADSPASHDGDNEVLVQDGATVSMGDNAGVLDDDNNTGVFNNIGIISDEGDTNAKDGGDMSGESTTETFGANDALEPDSSVPSCGALPMSDLLAASPSLPVEFLRLGQFARFAGVENSAGYESMRTMPLAVNAKPIRAHLGKGLINCF